MHLHLTLTVLLVAATVRAQTFSWRHAGTRDLGNCQMVFDSERDRLIAYNGALHEWDGGRWVRRNVLSPPESFDYQLVYDSGRHRLVLLPNLLVPGATAVWEFDGSAWQLVHPTATPQPTPRVATAVAYSPALQMVVMAGGAGPAGPLPDTWGWDGANWTQLAASGPADHGTCAMAFHPPTGRLVLFGGETRGNETWTFDGQQWLRMNPTTSPRAFTLHRMTTDPSLGVVWLIDGSSGETWKWDGSDWTQAETFPTTDRSRFGFAADSSGCVVAGGFRMFSNRSTGASINAPVGETWQLRNHQWTQWNAGGPVLAQNTSIAYDEHRGRLVALDHTSNIECRTWEWDGSSWLDTGQRLDPVHNTIMCYDPFRGRTLAFGGLQPLRPLALMASDELRSWDGTSWTTVQTHTAPPGRSNAAMAFDLLRGEAVIYGGFNGSNLDDTWIWSGSSWRQAVTPSPGPRTDHAMTFDSQSGGVLMYGGLVNSNDTSETWLWDGAAWHQLQPSSTPPARHYHQLISTAAMPVPTLIGGQANGGIARSDRWQWINGDWRLLPERLPQLRLAISASKSAIDNFGNTVYLAEGSTWLGGTNVATTGDLGPGCVGGTVPSLRAIGDPALGNAGFAIELDGATPGTACVLGAGAGIGGRPIGTCTLYLPSIDIAIGAPTSIAGTATFHLPVPAETALIGLLFSMQAAASTSSAPLGFQLSDGLFGRIGR